MKTNLFRQSINQALTLILVVLPVASIMNLPLSAQTPVKAQGSCATPQQDVDLGRQAAGEAEKQFQMLTDARAQDYLNRLGQNLAQYAPGEKFQYSFKLLNVGDINAFALPGGFTYVNRGTIEAAKNEAVLIVNSKNVVSGSIHAEGSVIVGDNNSLRSNEKNER